MTLRSVLHKLEADGHVDVTLGGHTFVRPPSVANGQQKDFFHITKTSELCWRPNGMQIKSAKMNNIMSMYVVLVIDNVALAVSLMPCGTMLLQRPSCIYQFSAFPCQPAA